MSTTTASGPDVGEWPVAGLAGAAAGLVRSAAVFGLGAGGVAVVPGAATGVAYGVALWTGNVAVGWTLLAAAVPALPAGGSLLGPLLGHVVYGGLLGGLYAAVRRRR